MSHAPQIDLNSDVGESFGSWTMGDDAAIMPSVSSANVACGFHAGDPSGIAQTCRDAVAAGVTIGAHVGYRDLAGFGRRFLDCTPTELADDVLYQIGALDALARAAGGQVRYVKPHGALYNTIVRHEAHAQAVVDGVKAFGSDLPLLLLPGSVALDKAAAAGLAASPRPSRTAATTRAARSSPAASPVRSSTTRTTSPRMVRLATEGVVAAVDGTDVRVDAESICLHGDTPGAVAMAAAVRRALEGAGVSIKAFA